MPNLFLRISFSWFTLLLLAMLPQTVRGQDDPRLVIRGVVVDADSSQALPSVHLRIQHTRRGGVTDARGRFNTRVNPTDTLVFTSVGYAPFVLVPADSTEQRRQNLVIRMKPQVTVLEEVKFKDYGDITKYIRREYDTTVDLRRPRGKPLFEKPEPKEQKAVQTGVSPNGARLEGAVTAFANLFNDEFQQKKKLKELLAQEEAQAQQEAVRRAMTERYQAMVLEAAALNEADLRQFTGQYMPPPYALLEMNDYQVMEGIVEGLKHFGATDIFLDELLRTGRFERQ